LPVSINVVISASSPPLFFEGRIKDVLTGE